MTATAGSPPATPLFRQAPSPRLPDRQIPLGERLVQAGELTAKELEVALGQKTNKKNRLGETLLELGFVTEETLLHALGQQLGVPAVQLRDGLVDPQVVHYLPRHKAQDLCAISMFKVRNTLSVAMAEPHNLHQIDEITRITGLRIKPVLGLRSDIESLIPRCYEDDFAVDAITADLSTDAIELQDDSVDIDLSDVQSLADGSPIINLVNFIIVNALRQKASDIHVEAGNRSTVVRFRVDGQLREVLRPRRDFHTALISRLKVMAKLDIAEHRIPQDGRIHVLVEGREIDLRISTLPTIQGEKVVMRILDRSNVTFNLDALGVPDTLLGKIKTMLGRPHGLLLVTGPTGSGKTTTLYSAIELIKSVTRNIVTVEDPVEYQLEQINQVPVGSNNGMSFPVALRSILRQDPDVILVGEIRDAETAMVAIQAALTGHLVLSTLHTNDSFSAVTRLVDMGIEPFKIAAALVGVIAQRLVRTICLECKTACYPEEEQLAMIGYTGDTRQQFMRGEGCHTCFDTGFSGRLGIYEVLMANPKMRQLIAEGNSLDSIRECHLEQAGTLLVDEGIALAKSGKTTLEEVARVAYVE